MLSFIYQEKGGIFSGRFKKAPKLSEAPQLEEVVLPIKHSLNKMIYNRGVKHKACGPKQAR